MGELRKQLAACQQERDALRDENKVLATLAIMRGEKLAAVEAVVAHLRLCHPLVERDMVISRLEAARDTTEPAPCPRCQAVEAVLADIESYRLDYRAEICAAIRKVLHPTPGDVALADLQDKPRPEKQYEDHVLSQYNAEQLAAVERVLNYMDGASASDHTLCATFGKVHKILAAILHPTPGTLKL